MHEPPLVGWLLVVIGAATGLSCLLRTRTRCGLPAGERGVARAEAIKGFGMALMAVPAPALDQRPWGTPLFAVVFGAMALWSATLLRGGAHSARHVPHLAVGAAAMVYMTVVTAAPPSGGPAGGGAGMEDMAGMGGGITLVNWALLAYFGLYAVWAGLRMLAASEVLTDAVAAGPAVAGMAPAASPLRPPAAPAGPVPRGHGLFAAPELMTACRVAMGIGMFAMVLVM